MKPLLFPGNHRYGSHNRSVEGILAWVATQRAAQQLAAQQFATATVAAQRAAGLLTFRGWPGCW